MKPDELKLPSKNEVRRRQHDVAITGGVGMILLALLVAAMLYWHDNAAALQTIAWVVLILILVTSIPAGIALAGYYWRLSQKQ